MDGIASSGATGSVQTTTRTIGATGCLFFYNGTLPQITGTGLPAQVDLLVISNPSNVTLTSPTSIVGSGTGQLLLDNGSLILGANDVTIGAGAPAASITVTGAFSATKMIITNSTGSLRKTFTAPSAVSFTWPIGENTGVTEYSPATLVVTSGGNGTIGLRVTDANHPNYALSANYISRYWSASTTFGAAHSWNGNFTYSGTDISE